MVHQLDFIKPENVLDALQQIDMGAVPKNNDWSEYWLNFNGKLYQFKYVVEIASTFTSTPIQTTDFTSNDSSRNYISSLGFQILFKSNKIKDAKVNYWIGASYYGLRGNLINMFDEFIRKKYWRTDHDLTEGEGLKVFNELKKIKINDRIGIRFFDKKGSKVRITAVGTISDTSKIDDGYLEVMWDYSPPEYKGIKPSGSGSGNWWKTLFQLKRHSDISQIFKETLIENRIARVAWNDLGWVMPSGSFGKSEHKDSHEAHYGYGHEEWLFDTSKIIKGFHYGFLEPVRKEQDAYSNKVYDVWLYSINGETKKRFWIGEIKNLIVIDSKEADEINQIYINEGWLIEMEEQIKASGANEKGFSDWKGLNLFNVKFRPSDIFINDPYFELPDSHPINDQSRYAFGHFREEYEINDKLLQDNFSFINNPNDNNDDSIPKSKTYIRQPRSVEIAHIHKAISNSLTKTLKEKYGKENVTREHPAGYGANRIDIVVNNGSNLIFYEIKTYNSIKTSIREAFGQLMEYCFYPDKQKAKELIIVTQFPADKQTKDYFNHLRGIFKELPIYYQSYNLEARTLSDKC
ncbi:MAG TPA: hypothetical protein VNW99_08860 [Cytophagaceae bacterium]|jgi:hypothetical protein|nr:hypothetical protein [Cytophagaceae bacterium]